MKQKDVSLEKSGLLINGFPMFLFACDFHYNNISFKNWENGLKKYKNLGFNAISVYIPWSFHEIKEGNLDFKTENKNLKKLFNLCKKLNLFIYCRIGPRSSSQIPNFGYPTWLFEKYKEIMDIPYSIKYKCKKKKKPPIISFLHPVYLEKVQNWYTKIVSVISNFQYPKGNIILIQIENELLYSFEDMYFSFGYSQFNQDLYRKWLKNKYLLIPIFNEIYSTNYQDFESILPPSPPLKDDFQKLNIIPYLEWLEFKESLLIDYIRKLFEFTNEQDINIPLILNLWSYKSPISVKSLFTSAYFKNFDLPFDISLNFYPIVFNAQVNVNCYINWHSEWLKCQSQGSVFISNIQESEFDRKIIAQNTQNILRLSLAHGIKSLSFSNQQKTDENNDQSKNNILNLGRFKELQNFKIFLDLHFESLKNSKKAYDPLSVAYYHPVTRLKSFSSSINSKSFSFPINYEHLKYSYKNLLQLLTKSFLQYDVVDLQTISQDELARRPFLMLYYLGWFEHENMIKLINYVANGGIIISFGDIPFLNEKMEKDTLLLDLYGAKCVGELQEIKECKLNFSEGSETFDNIESLFEYEIQNIKNVNIIAQKGKSKHFLAFSRKIKRGKIIHSGIMPKKDILSLKLINLLLEEADFPIQNISATSECVIIQNISDSDERFITVGNLFSEPKKSVSFTFYNPSSKKYPKDLMINEITLPPHTFSVWHAFKVISKEVIIHYSTGEIYSIKKEKGNYTIFIRFLVHPSFPNDFTAKIALWVSQHNLKFEATGNDIKITGEEKKMGKFKEFTILSNYEASFSFNIGVENYTFNLKKYYVPGDEI
ncbi:MAG: beta-galactosidase [Promethearchaeota archaeon]